MERDSQERTREDLRERLRRLDPDSEQKEIVQEEYNPVLEHARMQSLLKFYRQQIYLTLLDAQALARRDYRHFASRDTRAHNPERKTYSRKKGSRLHPNTILGKARKHLSRWVSSDTFQDYLIALEWEDPQRVARMIIQEFARGLKAAELEAGLKKYRSLKQGHAGIPLNKGANDNDREETDREEGEDPQTLDQNCDAALRGLAAGSGGSTDSRRSRPSYKRDSNPRPNYGESRGLPAIH